MTALDIIAIERDKNGVITKTRSPLEALREARRRSPDSASNAEVGALTFVNQVVVGAAMDLTTGGLVAAGKLGSGWVEAMLKYEVTPYAETKTANLTTADMRKIAIGAMHPVTREAIPRPITFDELLRPSTKFQTSAVPLSDPEPKQRDVETLAEEPPSEIAVSMDHQPPEDVAENQERPRTTVAFANALRKLEGKVVVTGSQASGKFKQINRNFVLGSRELCNPPTNTYYPRTPCAADDAIHDDVHDGASEKDMFLAAFYMMDSICRQPRENFSARFERFKEALGTLDEHYKITELGDVMRLCTSKDADDWLERVMALEQENKPAAAAELAVWLASAPTRWNVWCLALKKKGVTAPDVVARLFFSNDADTRLEHFLTLTDSDAVTSEERRGWK